MQRNIFKKSLGTLLFSTIILGGSLFAFTIETNIDNALQVIKSIFVTTDGLQSGTRFMTIDGQNQYVNIGSGASSGETLNISGTIMNTFVSNNRQYGLVSNNTIFGGTPGAGGYASSGDEFVFGGVDFDGGKLSSELTYYKDNISQFISTSRDGALVHRQSTNPSLHTNTILAHSGGISQQIANPSFGSYNFTWGTNNTELMRLTNSGYVGIGTGEPSATLTVSGSFLAQHNQAAVSVSPGLSSGNVFYPLPTASLLLIDPNATGLTSTTGLQAQVSVFDTRGVNLIDPQVGTTMATFSPSAFDQQHRASISTQNADNIALDVEDSTYHTSLDIERDMLTIYSSGGFASMYFDGTVGLFGFGGNNPGNTIDIAGAYVPGTAGLRFSHWTSSSGQILGLNSNGDVVLLGNISGFGGGGGAAGPWEYGGGSPLSAQIAGSANNAVGPYTVVGGYNNTAVVGAAYGFIGGGQNNTVLDRHSSIVGGSGNINWADRSFVGGGEGNTIAINSNASTIVGGFMNTIQSPGGFIGGGAGNTLTGGDGLFLGGGANNIINEGNQSVIVGGRNHTLSGSRSFIGGGSDNIIDSASYASILGGNMNSVYDDNSIIVGGESNINRGYGDLIGGGIMNSINGSWSAILGGNSNTLTGAGESILVGGSENSITNGNFSFLGAGRQNTIRTSPGDGYNTLVGGQANLISGGMYNSIVGGYDNSMRDGAYSFIGGGFNNSANVFYGTILGGLNNVVAGMGGSIAGGLNNSSAGPASFVGGGSGNIAFSSFAATIGGNNIYANGIGAAIVGGHTNYANGANSFIAGSNNSTSGDNTVALGSYASAAHDNTFVRSDGLPSFASLTPNTFLIKATNGVGINTNDPQKALHVNGAIVSEQLFAGNGFESGPFDVQGVNSIAIDTVLGTGELNCLFNGTRGQVVHVFKTSVNNAITVEHESSDCASTDHQIRLLSEVDRNFGVGMYGGITLVYDGNYWYVMATESSFVP